MINNEEWVAGASCADPDAEFVDFYSNKPEDQETAKALCAACPVRKLCIQYALDNSERFGRWGAAEDELRRDQAIDSLGHPYSHKRKRIRCPYCGPRSTKNLVIIERRRTKTHLQCSVCEIQWWARKSINARGTNF